MQDGEQTDVYARIRELEARVRELERTSGAIREPDADPAKLQERLHLAAEAAKLGVFEWQMGTGEVLWSRELHALHGVSPGSFPGTYAAWLELVHPEDRARVEAAVQQAIVSGRFAAEWRVIWPDASVHWVEGRAVIERNAAGQPHLALGVNLDVTERKNTEQALRRSELVFRRLAESNLFGVGIGAMDGRITYLNDEMLRMMGRTREEAESGRLNWQDCIAPEHRPEDPGLGERLLRDGKILGYERAFVRPDGSRTPFMGAASLVGPGDDLHVSIALDLTQIRAVEKALRDNEAKLIEDIQRRKQTEERLRTSEAKYRLLTDLSPMVIWLSGPDGAGTFFNASWTELTGLVQRDSLGDGWTMAIHAPHRTDVLCRWRAAVRAAKAYEDEIPLVRAADGQPRWHLTRALPYRDQRGHVQGWVAVAVDISDRKRAEEDVREDARRKDEFLAMLAHELRNPLAAMSSALDLLGRRLARGEPADGQLEVLTRQNRSLRRIVDDLLDVSRITRGLTELHLQALDVGGVVRGALEATRALVQQRGHHISVTLPETPLLVLGDPVRLEQVVANLLTNAAKYTDPGGWIRIVVEAAGDMVQIVVVDSGIGIEPSLLERIFDLFEQAERNLDRSQGGLGIGLTIVKRLVHLHGGTIEAHSDGPGKGSEFVVRLPVAKDIAQTVDRDTASSPTRAASARRVLIVEDSRDIAESLAELVVDLGHRVQVAMEGRSALELAIAWQPDVVLLDIGLPGMNGYEVARRLRALENAGTGRRAHLVALTGYGQREDQEQAHQAGFDRHVVKPISMDVLEEILAGWPSEMASADVHDV